MYHLNMERQMNNARNARMPMLPEQFVGNKNSLLLSQVQVNNQVNNHSTPDRSMTTSGNKHLRHKLLLSNDAKRINLVPIDYVPETFRGTLSKMVSKSTTPHKPT
jgi:hypothetical protein